MRDLKIEEIKEIGGGTGSPITISVSPPKNMYLIYSENMYDQARPGRISEPGRPEGH